jgi:hypothetical protein
MNKFIRVSMLLVVTASAARAQYDFDDKNRNDMQGAWKMCVVNGFTEGDCPSIYSKCWQSPMVYYRHGHLKTYCVKTPSFSGSEADGQRALDYAITLPNRSAN